MEAKDHLKIAQIMFAMEQKRRRPDTLDTLRNERCQRTFTDEYSFNKKPVPREPIPEEIRSGWAKLAARNQK